MHVIILIRTKFGGIGLRASTTHSAAAYISSFVMSKSLVESFMSQRVSNRHITDAISRFNSLVHTDHCLVSSSCPSSQQDLSHHIDSECFHKLQVESNSLNKARLLACSMPHANAWIRALPSQQKNFFLFEMVYLYEKMAWNANLQPRPSLFSLSYAFYGCFWTLCFCMPDKRR